MIGNWLGVEQKGGGSHGGDWFAEILVQMMPEVRKHATATAATTTSAESERTRRKICPTPKGEGEKTLF